MGMGMHLLSISISISMWLLVTTTSARAQSPRELDALLQDYAYRAFLRPRTGIVYDGVVPSNLTGIQVSAMRLRSGSLRTRGVNTYKEFEIPKGLEVHPYVERLVLVYQNLGNWSITYYPLEGYSYLAPVLGLLAYDASDLSAKNLPELHIQPTAQPISVQFSELLSRVPDGSVPKCALFDLNGTVNFSNVLSNNICTTFQQGHISIVIESIAPSASPPSQPPAGATPLIPRGRGNGNGTSNKKTNSKKVWIIVGSVLGGFALLVMLGLLAMWVSKYKRRKKMHQMERAAEVGESLHMTSVGTTKAPAATGTRTQPTLETEYVP